MCAHKSMLELHTCNFLTALVISVPLASTPEAHLSSPKSQVSSAGPWPLPTLPEHEPHWTHSTVLPRIAFMSLIKVLHS